MGLCESACYRNCKWIEDILIKSKEFSLPGKKALLKSDTEFEVILIDATESPIERPKKRSDAKIGSEIEITNRKDIIPGKRKAYAKESGRCR